MRHRLPLRAVLMALAILAVSHMVPAYAAPVVAKDGLHVTVFLGGTGLGRPLCFVVGEGATGPDATVTLLRDGQVIRRQTTPTFVEQGFFAAEWECDPDHEGKLRIGDLIVAESGGEMHRLRLPDLRADIDVLSDRASGKAPRGSLELVMLDCVIGSDCQGDRLTLNPEIRRNGRWSVDMHGRFDIRGGDAMVLTWTSPYGDSVGMLAAAPHITVQNGSAQVTGHANPDERVRVELFGQDGAFKAFGEQRVTNDEGTFSITVRRDGNPVPVEVGDRLRSNVFPGAALESIEANLVVDSETSFVTALCVPKAEWQVQVTTPVSISLNSGAADASGLVSRGHLLLPEELPMLPDDEVKLWCTNSQGNSQLFVANPV